jgi:LAO/AO transport system kinase
MLLEMRPARTHNWSVPIYRAQAFNGIGIDDLVGGIQDHHQMLHREGVIRRRKQAQIRTEFLNILQSFLMKNIVNRLDESGELDKILEKVAARTVDPYTAAEGIIRTLIR